MSEYTRETEALHTSLHAAASKATLELLPVERRRHKHMVELGNLLWSAPRDGGTLGLASWAVANAVLLVEMLDPFVKEGP